MNKPFPLRGHFAGFGPTDPVGNDDARVCLRDELTILLTDLESLFGSARRDRDIKSLQRALDLIAAENDLLPRVGPARSVNETLHLTSEPPLVSPAATRRWIARAERCARRMRKRIQRSGD